MAAASNMVTFGLLSAETRFACSRSRGAAGAGAGSSLSSRTLATDASLTGWGAVMSGRLACGLWSGRHLMWHINCLEMLALFLALNTFSRELRDRHVLVRTGNTAVVSYINHQGGLRSRHLYRLAHQILGWSQGKVVSLRTVHIPGHLNMVVDILSRQGPSPGEWMVKQRWWSRLGEFGQAQVDMFVTQETLHCPLWFSLTHPAPRGLEVLQRVCRISKRAPFWPGRVCLDLISLLNGSLWRFPQGGISSLRRRVWSVTPAWSGGSYGFDLPGGAHLVASGLSIEVVETILQPRAPSKRKLYALKRKLSLLGAVTAISTLSTAQLVQFWSSCRPVSPQGWPTPP